MAMMEQDEVRMYEVLGFTLSKVVLSCDWAGMIVLTCTRTVPLFCSAWSRTLANIEQWEDQPDSEQLCSLI